MTMWLARNVMEFMRSECLTLQPLETGGILLGWRRGDATVVAAALGPGPAALHGRHLFIPDDRWHTTQVKAVFASSGGDLNYLGDWHSHPGGVAAMSSLDEQTLARVSRRIGTGMMVILAGDLLEGSPIACWTGHRSSRLLGRANLEVDELRIFEGSERGWPDFQSSQVLGS